MEFQHSVAGGLNRVTAHDGGQQVGELHWYPDNGMIQWVDVHPQYRRHGVGTQMLEKARQIDPSVHHSQNLTNDGAAWSEKKGMMKIRDASAEQSRKTCRLCDRDIWSRDLCNTHYKSERKAGRLPVVSRPSGATLEDAFAWHRPGDPPPSGCWDWPSGKLDEDGYGWLSWAGRQVRAHRASYEIFNGPIPDLLLVRHTCDRRLCVQPLHLVTGTNDENMADMVNRERARRGVEHHNAVLGPDEVREIRRRVSGGESQKSVARLLGVSTTAIHRVITGKTWSHVN